MAADIPDDLTPEERTLFDAFAASAELASRCRQLREMNAMASETALETVINTLMTDLWDQFFSQTDIQKAFMAALADMNRYAAGRERRDSR